MESEKQSNLPAQAGRNVFTAYGDYAGGGSAIVGEILKFSKGDWLAGKDGREIPNGTRLVAVMDSLSVGWQRWENQRPTATRMGLLVEDFTPPKRAELGDTDEELWPHDDDDGEPKDPWQFTNHLQLVDPKDANAIFTFTTSSRGGLGAVGGLSQHHGKAIEREGRSDQYPLVELSSGSYAHSNKAYGRIKYPAFHVVGWVDKITSAPADDIGDEVPY